MIDHQKLNKAREIWRRKGTLGTELVILAVLLDINIMLTGVTQQLNYTTLTTSPS